VLSQEQPKATPSNSKATLNPRCYDADQLQLGSNLKTYTAHSYATFRRRTYATVLLLLLFANAITWLVYSEWYLSVEEIASNALGDSFRNQAQTVSQIYQYSVNHTFEAAYTLNATHALGMIDLRNIKDRAVYAKTHQFMIETIIELGNRNNASKIDRVRHKFSNVLLRLSLLHTLSAPLCLCFTSVAADDESSCRTFQADPDS
jgi:hypothetical protein